MVINKSKIRFGKRKKIGFGNLFGLPDNFPDLQMPADILPDGVKTVNQKNGQ